MNTQWPGAGADGFEALARHFRIQPNQLEDFLLQVGSVNANRAAGNLVVVEDEVILLAAGQGGVGVQ